MSAYNVFGGLKEQYNNYIEGQIEKVMTIHGCTRKFVKTEILQYDDEIFGTKLYPSIRLFSDKKYEKPIEIIPKGFGTHFVRLNLEKFFRRER